MSINFCDPESCMFLEEITCMGKGRLETLFSVRVPVTTISSNIFSDESDRIVWAETGVKNTRFKKIHNIVRSIFKKAKMLYILVLFIMLLSKGSQIKADVKSFLIA